MLQGNCLSCRNRVRLQAITSFASMFVHISLFDLEWLRYDTQSFDDFHVGQCLADRTGLFTIFG